MSKQLKLKFKKTLKKAEFVHADLEYHQELFAEAKVEFNEEVTRLLKELPPEEQARLQAIVDRKISEEIAQRMGAQVEEEREEAAQTLNSTLLLKRVKELGWRSVGDELLLDVGGVDERDVQPGRPAEHRGGVHQGRGGGGVQGQRCPVA